MQPIKIELLILTFNDSEFKGFKFSNIEARYNGKILKFKLDRTKVGDISHLVDKEVEADIEIQSGDKMHASLRIVAVRPQT